MMNREKIIALPHNLADHDDLLPVVYEEGHEVREEEVVEEVEELEGEQIIEVAVSETYTLIPGVHKGSRIYVDILEFEYYKRQVGGHRVYV